MATTSKTTTGIASRASPGTTHTVSHTVSKAKPGKTAVHAESHTASKTTTDHEAIRKWAERRGGHPTSVTGTEHGKETAGVLRLDFGVKDEKLHAVDWNAFFDKFEEAKLAFLYQDKTSDGKMSRFHKFIHRH
jgi:fructose 1,6-bisphosphatase